ncbi:MAG: hypothetical protein ACJAT5_000110, partial [Lentimonas sp.]
MSERERRSIWGQYFKCFILLLLSLLLAQCTLWREMDEFWLNSGGYPIWLRECLMVLYYPCLFFVMVAAITLSRSVCRQFFRSLRFYGYEVLLVTAWVVILASLALMLANNVASLFELRTS